MTQLTLADALQTNLALAYARARRTQEMIRIRGVAAFNRAFGWNNAPFCGCVLNNALIDMEQNGRGWNASIKDRSALRLAAKLIDHDQYRPMELYDTYARRMIRARGF